MVYRVSAEKLEADMGELVLQEAVEKRIFIIRGQRVMLDRDLAELYGVKIRHLNR